MKHLSLLVLLLFFSHQTNAQTKAVPPYESEQFVRNIIQELDIPDETFDKMRGKDNLIKLKLFLDDKGKVMKTTIANDEFELETLLHSIIKEFPNFTPPIVNGEPKSSVYNLSFILNEYTYYKIVNPTATPEIEIEKFIKKIYRNINISDLKKQKLDNSKNGKNHVFIIDFFVEKDGSLSNFEMRDKEMDFFKDRMVSAMKKASEKWIPGKINGKPVRSKSAFSLTFNIDFY